MLAEILANPIAWPLWAVFLFAATMYPLGFMLPGCVCCASGCTTCGIVATGYATGQNQYGRMCCDGTMATSITLRITSVGVATGTSVSRSIPAGGYYTRKTKTWSCTTLDGDYVLSINRYVDNGHSCGWLAGYIADVSQGLSVFPFIYNGPLRVPSIDLAFPDWQLFSRTQFRNGFTRSVRTQTCSGYPDFESCTIGSTSSESVDGYVGDTPLNYYGPDGGGLVTTGPVFSTQKCDPSGTVFSTTAKIYTDLVPDSLTDSGCTVKVELV